MSEVENKILHRIEEYLKEYADDYQKIVVEGGMFGDSIEFTAGYGFMKELMNYIKKQEHEIERLNNELQDFKVQDISNQEKLYNLIEENERLNNIINELKEWFKGYHQSYASCKWYEGDYIEFIEHLENELKGSDTNG